MNIIEFSENSLVYFKSRINKKKKYNIIKILEKNSNFYKIKFSKIINSFNYKKIFKEDSYSKSKFWHLSDFFEKNIWKNVEILDVLRLIALEKILKSDKIIELHSTTDDFKLYFYLKNFCLNNDIKFNKKSEYKFLYKKIIFNLKYYITPFVEIIKFIKENILMIPFLFLKKDMEDKKNLIISYSTIFQNNKIDDFYWKNLDKNISDLNSNKLIINSDNKNNLSKISISKKNSKKNIFFLQSYQGISSFFITLIIWLFFLKKIFFMKKNVQNNYFLKNYFRNCFFKISFLRNINYFFLFKVFFSKGYHDNIYYLFENISWEKSLNISNHKSKLYPYQHSSVRNWDFRYHLFNFDKKIFKRFMPSLVFSTSIYNRFKLSKILNGIQIINTKSARYKLFTGKLLSKKNKSILLLGDIDNNETIDMIRLLRTNENFTIYLKLHPASNFKIKYNNIKIVNEKLSKLLTIYDKILCSNSTTSVFEVILAKRKPFVYLGVNKLNLCPLKSFKGINFISNNKDLIKFKNTNTNIDYDKFIKKFF